MAQNITEFQKNLYIIDDGRVREFLVVGENSALLVDTGFEDGGVAAAVRSITDKPVRVILTHGDMDHTGGLGAFSECSLHPGDRHMITASIETGELVEGQFLRCGEYGFEVLHMPGHTNGSIMLFDEEKGLLISGDLVQSRNPIFMFGPERNLPLYIKSMEELSMLEDKINIILPSHGTYPLSSGVIRECIKAARELEQGHLTGEKHAVMPCNYYRYNDVEFYY